MSEKQLQSGCVALVCFALMGVLILAAVIANLIKPKPDIIVESKQAPAVTDTVESDDSAH